MLSSWKGKAQLLVNILLGGIDGAFSTTNKYKLFKNIYNVINTCYNAVSSGFDVLSIVIECVISYVCSKMFRTEQTFRKFNSNKIKNKARTLFTNFKSLSMKKIKEFAKVIKNQIVYYVKSNSKVYKRFIKNYSLSTVSSWLSKLPELARAIKSLA